MKNINIVITSILAIAVAVLFYMQISANKKNATPTATKPQNSKGCLIAYFEMDSIESQYDYYKDVKKELDKKQLEAQNMLAKKENENANIIRGYQNKFKDLGANGNVSDAEKSAAMQAQQHVAELEKDLQQSRQELANKVSNDVRTELSKVKEKIEAYLKDYNKNNTYAFIFSNSTDMIYYKDSTYNITNDLIKGLNEEYKKKK
ncbi:MAG: OmpH family outer membrane protein [Bacteroidetes bacterium]|jgi:outer membrane protein|nr:OmpH family outer membrane protein [Bacteroidota bacterium]